MGNLHLDDYGRAGQARSGLARSDCREDFRFMFASGWETSEILYSNAQGVASLICWRNKLLTEIKHLLGSPRTQHVTVMKGILKKLDFGRWFIIEGYDWLKTQLHVSLLP